MFRKLAVIFIVSLFAPRTGDATGYVYDYSNNCREAYQNYMSMHFPEARAAIFRELKANPYNLLATYISDYEDCIVLMLNCSSVDYEQRKEHFDQRLSLLEKGDENSPWYRLCKAGLYLHWALVHMRFDEKFKTVTTFRKSYLLIKENERLFPSFEYNQLFSGLEQAVAGTIPDNYKWIASIFGMKGNVNKGMNMLSTFIKAHNERNPLYAEAVIFDAYLRFYILYQQPEVWSFLNSSQFPTKDNLLNVFIKSNIAVNYRHADVCIQTLEAALHESKDYGNYPIFDYLMGCALLSKQDATCVNYFRRYLNNNKNKLYIKDSWQKLALAYYLQHDMTQATACRKQIASHGSTQVDADRQAARFGDDNTWPNAALLQARCLIDGGYYSKALEKMSAINEAQLTSVTDKLEYNFRLGRVYDEMGDETKAFRYYQAAINAGKDRQEHFASRAALQMGFVYERSGRKQEAINKYKECLNMHSHDFQNSIDQQAKAGINRLSVK